jgi:hypothetical protein
MYGLLLSLVAAEFTLSLLTWSAFNAESRIEKDRDRDIRDAMAGYSSGRVIPALADLIDNVLDVRRPDESIRDALTRHDTSAALDQVVEAAATSKSPRTLESSLVRMWTCTGCSNVVVQVAAPLLLLNAILNDDVLSRTLQTVSGVALVAGMTITIVSLIAVRQLSQALTRATRAGKDAGDGA